MDELETAFDGKLAEFLFNKTRRKLLTLIFGHPDEGFYVNQIVQRLEAGTGAVQRELKTMTEVGIISREKKGNQVYYRANSKSPIFAELHGLMEQIYRSEGSLLPGVESRLGTRFGISKHQLSAFCHQHHIQKLSLFGSVLREDFRPESDIDVLVDFEAGYVPGFGIVAMENELSGILGRKVDLRTPSDLSRYFRDKVVQEAKVKYEHTQP